MSNDLLQAKCILVVEDEEDIRQALVDELRLAGFKTLEAKDGQEGLELAMKEPVDLMLLDMVMPKKDGFDVLEELQKFEKHPPVIVVSNLSQDEDMKRSMRLGAHEFIVKSNIPIGELIGRVKTFFSL